MYVDVVSLCMYISPMHLAKNMHHTTPLWSPTRTQGICENLVEKNNLRSTRGTPAVTRCEGDHGCIPAACIQLRWSGKSAGGARCRSQWDGDVCNSGWRCCCAPGCRRVGAASSIDGGRGCVFGGYVYSVETGKGGHQEEASVMRVLFPALVFRTTTTQCSRSLQQRTATRSQPPTSTLTTQQQTNKHDIPNKNRIPTPVHRTEKSWVAPLSNTCLGSASTVACTAAHTLLITMI